MHNVIRICTTNRHQFKCLSVCPVHNWNQGLKFCIREVFGYKKEMHGIMILVFESIKNGNNLKSVKSNKLQKWQSPVINFISIFWSETQRFQRLRGMLLNERKLHELHMVSLGLPNPSSRCYHTHSNIFQSFKYTYDKMIIP